MIARGQVIIYCPTCGAIADNPKCATCVMHPMYVVRDVRTCSFVYYRAGRAIVVNDLDIMLGNHGPSPH